jgi:hypothetical protein
MPQEGLTTNEPFEQKLSRLRMRIDSLAQAKAPRFSQRAIRFASSRSTWCFSRTC